jgi:ubiquinone/menaquinone biosynthesis C-methylase UbiE
MTAERSDATSAPAVTARHVIETRAGWEHDSRDYQERNAAQLDRWDRLGWGTWDVSEDDLGVLGDVDGADVLEYGCGANQFGIKLAMRGARVTGLDFSHTQLLHGQEHMRDTGMHLPVVEADGERIPLRDGSFDLVVCDHGVMTFADPHRTVPEAARVLRRDGSFVFNMASPLIWLAWGEGPDDPPGHELRRDYFGMFRQTAEEDGHRTTEFQLPYGEWIRLFRANGLTVEDLIELRPPEDATTTYAGFSSLDWALRFPAENIWKLRKA